MLFLHANPGIIITTKTVSGLENEIDGVECLGIGTGTHYLSETHPTGSAEPSHGGPAESRISAPIATTLDGVLRPKAARLHVDNEETTATAVCELPGQRFDGLRVRPVAVDQSGLRPRLFNSSCCIAA